MSKETFQPHESGIVGITESDTDTTNRQLTIVSKTEDVDSVVLQSLGNPRKTRALPEEIMSIVADRILKLGLPNGSKMVLPTTGVIMRTLYNVNLGEKTLVELSNLLLAADTPGTKFQRALHLGDAATHYAAGYTGNKNIRKLMGAEELHSFAKTMAQLGYTTALSQAERGEETLAKKLAPSIHELITRFRELVDIIMLIKDTESIEDINRRKSLKDVNPVNC